MERLRHVARAGRAEQTVLVQEVAGALASLAADPAELVTACQRLLDRHPAAGALWNLCAHLLAAGDEQATRAAAWSCHERVAGDRTGRRLAAQLPDGATVVVVGWPEVGYDGLVRRGDLDVVAVDADGHAAALAGCLADADVGARWVPVEATGQVVAAADLVLIEAEVWGGAELAATAGALAAATVARHSEVPVWVTVGAARAVHRSLWPAVATRLRPPRPGDGELDILSADLVDAVIGPQGLTEVVARTADGPHAAELLAPPRGSGH